MTLTYDQIKPFVDAGATTASQVLTAMQTDQRTANPIPIDDLMHLLNVRGMLRKLTRTTDSGEKWSGTVHAMLKAAEASGNASLNDAQALFFSHITNPRNVNVDLTDAAFAAAFAGMAATYADQTGMPTTADFDAVYQLGGGLKWASVTEADIQAAMDLQAKRVMIDAALTPIRSRANAIESWLLLESTLAMSTTDLQAFIADIVSTTDGNPSQQGGGE